MAPAKTTYLPASWQDWLELNLERGCSHDEIVSVLNEHGFDGAAVLAMTERAKENMRQVQADAVDHAALTRIRLTTRGPEEGVRKIPSDKIQLYCIDDFLDASACRQLIALSESSLKPSLTASTHKEGKPDYAGRTSTTSYLSHLDNPIVEALDQSIARFIGIHPAYAEGVQAQKYTVGQEFRSHVDYLSSDVMEYESYMRKGGNRTWTFMIYLNNTPKGGATAFPNIDTQFYPKCGMALAWNNLRANGLGNPYTMHSGMPVEAGEKYVITKWFREKCMAPMLYPF